MEPRRTPTRTSTSTSGSGGSVTSPIHTHRDILKKMQRFRVLIMGRANAGKTTILKKICNATKDPAIYDMTGYPIDLSSLSPSAERGMHEIDYAMIFQSNPRFVFHDSRGFEAGGNDELRKVKAFLDKRNATTHLQDRVHAIWYCIPLDDDRPVQKPEIEFFETCGTGDIPVIAVFTKLDSLDDRAYGMIFDENPDIEEATARELIAPRSQQLFDELRPKLRIFQARYPPRSYVGLRDMDQPGSTCNDLLQHTAEALDNETLQLMFVAVQRSILGQCTQFAFENFLIRSRIFDDSKHFTVKEAQAAIFGYYPQLIEDLIDMTRMDDDVGVEMDIRERRLQRLRRLIMDHTSEGWKDLEPWADLRIIKLQETESIQARLAVLSHGVFSLSGMPLAELVVALAIIADHSFFLKQQNRDLDFKDSIEQAIQDFLKSSQYSLSRAAMNTALSRIRPQLQPKTNILGLKRYKDSDITRLSRALATTMVQIVQDHRLDIESDWPYHSDI